MKFLADENIGPKVVKFLRTRHHKVLSVLEDKNLHGSNDEFLISLANKKGYIIITLDQDFGELVFKGLRKTYGIILLRLSREREEDIINALSAFFRLRQNLKRKFILITDDRVKIRDIM